MSRGFGAVRFTSHLPDAVTAVAGVVTQLGDMWFVVAGICVLFVLASRYPSLTDTPANDSVYLLALTVGAYSLTVALKHAFAVAAPGGRGSPKACLSATVSEYAPTVSASR